MSSVVFERRRLRGGDFDGALGALAAEGVTEAKAVHARAEAEAVAAEVVAKTKAALAEAEAELAVHDGIDAPRRRDHSCDH